MYFKVPLVVKKQYLFMVKYKSMFKVVQSTNERQKFVNTKTNDIIHAVVD